MTSSSSSSSSQSLKLTLPLLLIVLAIFITSPYITAQFGIGGGGIGGIGGVGGYGGGMGGIGGSYTSYGGLGAVTGNGIGVGLGIGPYYGRFSPISRYAYATGRPRTYYGRFGYLNTVEPDGTTNMYSSRRSRYFNTSPPETYSAAYARFNNLSYRGDEKERILRRRRTTTNTPNNNHHHTDEISDD